MYRRRFHMFKFITACIISISLILVSCSRNARDYEAEGATLNANTKVRRDNTASNGQYVVFGPNCSIKWKVKTRANGWYRISLRYKAPESDAAQILSVNGKQFGIGFSACKKWSDACFTTYLFKGKNKIMLTPDYGKISIDYLDIPDDSLYLLPSISPVHNVFYKDHPAIVNLMADARGKKLKAVNSGNHPIDFSVGDYPYVEGAFRITLSTPSLLSLPLGNDPIDLTFDDGSTTRFFLDVKPTVSHAGLTLVLFDVEHGNSVLIIMPNGKKLLVDSGKEAYARSVVMPFLDRQHIDTLDYYLLTHYHDDHTGAKEEIKSRYHVQHFMDYKSLKTGDTLKFGSAVMTILNTFADGNEENDRSVSFLLSYNGFTYSHGADNYAITEDRIMKRFKSLSAQVFYANHHFHGSINPVFLAKTNPALVVVSAQQALYARGAYMDVYREKIEKSLYASHARLIETLFTLEAGTVVVRANGPNDWEYETYRNNSDIFIPGLTEK
jgi:competence protein ComEC